MNSSLRVLLVLLLTASVLAVSGGCGEEPRERQRILSFGTDDTPASYFASTPDADRGLLWFDAGWSHPENGAAWAVGKQSTLCLWLEGRDHELTLVAQTAPDLARRGQTVVISFNSTPVDTFELLDRWAETEVQVKLPAELVRSGMNDLSLHPAVHHTGDEGIYGNDRRQHSVRLLELTVTADVTSSEAQIYDRHVASKPPTWARAPLSSDRRVASVSESSADVLIIVLDAARPDHFGCYGYDRDTTPFIDSLAEDAVVFTEVFSTASYTRAAVPSLLTGLSWIEHGVVGGRDALSDSFLTIAEVFADAGYRTIGISANANASTSTGASQGFDDWTNVWQLPRYEEGNRFAVPAALAREKLEAGLGDRPVFCYVHLIPPHEPYQPGPEHDLWSTSGHSDWVDGSVDCLKRMLSLKGGWRDADLARLVSLYDGNLRFADSLVREIVEAWQSNRDRPLRVLIASDHGEAMGEHGFVGHNTTVYDAMTRIPLIAWPASAFKDWSKYRDKLLAITDIFPLVVANERVALPQGVAWPGHFRSILKRDRKPRSAVILRNGLTQYGVRKGRTLLFTDGWDEQVLLQYPSSDQNLRRKRAGEYRELAALLHTVVSDRQTLPANEQELSEEEIEALKALGYM